ncbi:MAG: S1-like domain-containing RNA-binding protein [Bacteroides sp.]
MSIELGKFNTLEVVKQVDFGMYLDGDEEGEILLPTRYVPDDCQIGDRLRVFLYLDIDERLIATTLTPLVQVGQFACLEVAWVNEFGAFLNWGLMKDLFVPFSEQKMKMMVGRSYVVHVHIDEQSFRIVASAKVDRYLSKELPPYKADDEVDILIWQKTDLGFKAIVDNQFSGLLYDGEIFQPLHTGNVLKAFVKQVREDGKIDLMLQKPGFEKIDDFAKTLLDYIEKHNGRIPLTDKSPAEDIYDTFGVSKKTFKKGVGDLYRKRLIVLQPDRIELAPPKAKVKQ